MKQHLHIALLAIAMIAIAAALQLSSCIGAQSKAPMFERALATWPAVRDDFQRGASFELETSRVIVDDELRKKFSDAVFMEGDKLERALIQRDILGLKQVDFELIEDRTYMGISCSLDAGDIGPGVAESLQEQARLFAQLINTLRED